MPFASMTQEDVVAFYELLDDYFESRKELFASWVNERAPPAAAPASSSPAHHGGPARTIAPPPAPRASQPPAPPALHHSDSAASATQINNTNNVTSPGSGPRVGSAPTNKYGITVPSMADLKDPRFQAGFKFAGKAAGTAGALLNKHVLQNPSVNSSASGTGGAPAPASKPSGFAGKAMSSFTNRNSSGPSPAAPTTSNARASPSPVAASHPPPPAHAPAAGHRGIGMATAQFDYSSNEAGDLPFRQGDRITLLAKESDDWWRGEVNGREGLFPASYVSEN